MINGIGAAAEKIGPRRAAKMDPVPAVRDYSSLSSAVACISTTMRDDQVKVLHSIFDIIDKVNHFEGEGSPTLCLLKHGEGYRARARLDE